MPSNNCAVRRNQPLQCLRFCLNHRRCFFRDEITLILLIMTTLSHYLSFLSSCLSNVAINPSTPSHHPCALCTQPCNLSCSLGLSRYESKQALRFREVKPLFVRQIWDAEHFSIIFCVHSGNPSPRLGAILPTSSFH